MYAVHEITGTCTRALRNVTQRFAHSNNLFNGFLKKNLFCF